MSCYACFAIRFTDNYDYLLIKITICNIMHIGMYMMSIIVCMYK